MSMPSSPHFAYFTFPGMLGMLTDSSYVVYDINAETPATMQGSWPERTLVEAQAYLQKLYDDIANR